MMYWKFMSNRQGTYDFGTTHAGATSVYPSVSSALHAAQTNCGGSPEFVIAKTLGS